MSIYVILLWVVWNKKEHVHVLSVLVGEHIRCFLYRTISLILQPPVKHPYTKICYVFFLD